MLLHCSRLRMAAAARCGMSLLPRRTPLRLRALSTRARTVRDLLATQQSGAVKFVGADESVVEASRQMVNNRTTSLAVKDPSTRRVVGLLTQGDIVRCCASKMTAEHMTLQTTSESLGVGGWDEPSDTHTSVRPVSWDVPVSEIMTPTKKVTPTHSAH